MVNVLSVKDSGANYNAVKLKINDARIIVPEGFKPDPTDNSKYNAIDVVANRPSVEVYKQPIYNYPPYNEAVTYSMAQIAPVDVPKSLPVPEPNVTTTEAEKNLAFHGNSFKAAPKQIEIIPPVDIKPDVDVTKVAETLTDSDYDVQAKQLFEIAKLADNKENLQKYIAPEIFESLIKMIEVDTSNLAKPTPEQSILRDKVKENMNSLAKAVNEGVDPKTFKFPNNLSDDEYKVALKLSPFEQAERNKSYALSVTALLAREYADGVKEQNGNVVPLTDLPGASVMVDTLRKESNPDVKLSAIDALMYISRPEYKDELATILSLAAKDKNIMVAEYAALALYGIDPV